MKQSKHVRLVLLGSVSAVSLSLLSACGDDSPRDGQSIFETVQECQEFGLTDCERRFSAALGNHISSGPRYGSEEACANMGHERCTEVSNGSGSSIWLPAMIGFMAGRAISGSRPVYLQGYQNPATRREREDRQVVAGHGGGSGAFVIGNYYGSGGYYRPGTLGSGMREGAVRVGANPGASAPGKPASVNSTAARSVVKASAARGGFGASGAVASAGS